MRKVTIIREHHSACAFCGEHEELRPYGPNGEAICFACAMKDEDAAKTQFSKLVEDDDVTVLAPKE